MKTLVIHFTIPDDADLSELDGLANQRFGGIDIHGDRGYVTFRCDKSTYVREHITVGDADATVFHIFDEDEPGSGNPPVQA